MSNTQTNLLEQYPELASLLAKNGTICPCCGQVVKMYTYKMYALSSLALIRLYQKTNKKNKPYHISEISESDGVTPRASHFAELRHWGLIVPEKNVDPKKKSSGYWRITDKGKQFVEQGLKIPEKIKMYNNTFFGFEGEEIDIMQSLGNDFNYYELMLK